MTTNRITDIGVLHKDPTKSRWSCNRVMLTDNKGNRFEAAWTNDELKKEQLRLQLIKAGADPAVLEEFEAAAYNQGRMDECDKNAGEAL